TPRRRTRRTTSGASTRDRRGAARPILTASIRRSGRKQRRRRRSTCWRRRYEPRTNSGTETGRAVEQYPGAARFVFRGCAVRDRVAHGAGGLSHAAEEGREL